MKLATALDHTRPSRRQWQAWTDQEPALANLSWDTFRRELRNAAPDRRDQLLAALVQLARRDPAAVAVLLACLTPGLRARIARHAPGLARDDAWAIAAAGVCTAIAGTHLPRSFVASRLLDAATRHLQRAVKAQRAWQRHSRNVPDRPSPTSSIELSAATCLRLAVDAGVLTPTDAWLIDATRVAGHSVAYAAGQLDIGYEAAKKRRQRAEARWATWWGPPTPSTRSTDQGAVA